MALFLYNSPSGEIGDEIPNWIFLIVALPPIQSSHCDEVIELGSYATRSGSKGTQLDIKTFASVSATERFTF